MKRLFELACFWKHVDDVKTMGLLLQAIQSTGNTVLFAIRHMLSARFKVVTKKWAKHWLGISTTWLTKYQRLTLLMALELVVQNNQGNFQAKQPKETKKRQAKQTQLAIEGMAKNAAVRSKREAETAFVRQVRFKLEPPYFDYGAAAVLYHQHKSIAQAIEELRASYERNRDMALVVI